ncbi:MAG: hypothetical protein WAM60_21965, partial [Candidatus Promineifilaceae bacterium]
LPMNVLIEKFASHWQAHILEIEKQKTVSKLNESQRLLEFRYETLCDRPKEILDQIAGFLNVSPELFDLTQTEPVKNMNYKFKERLESKTVRHLTKIMAPTLKMYGYIE